LLLLKKLGWNRVAALTEDGQKYTEYISHMQDYMQQNGIVFVANRKFPRERERIAMSHVIRAMKMQIWFEKLVIRVAVFGGLEKQISENHHCRRVRRRCSDRDV
jgi:Ni,Fe-hydrogenase I large subunit